MIRIEDFLGGFYDEFPFVPRELPPREIVVRLAGLIAGPSVHPSATIEPGAVVKPPAVIGAGCFVAATAYLRGGVVLGPGVTVGPGVEIKASLVMGGSALAHFNYVGDSLIGRDVNLEAGAVIANFRNEAPARTGKFGAVIGDHCRIGANAVLAPGTILAPRTIVPRLALVDQGGG